jgi:hypothetical protein
MRYISARIRETLERKFAEWMPIWCAIDGAADTGVPAGRISEYARSGSLEVKNLR